MATQSERISKLFDRYASSMRTGSLRWNIKGNSRGSDRRIRKYIKYFCLPIQEEEVIALLDTTTFRTGKEGILVTYSGIVVKEIASKLYYLKYDKIARVEVREKTDEYYNVETSLWVCFLDGTEKQIFDYYINPTFFAQFVNDVVQEKEYRDEE